MKRPARVVLSLSIAATTLLLIGCGSSPTQPSGGGASNTGVGGTTTLSGGDVLVDASKDGGVWWFPSPAPSHKARTIKGRHSPTPSERGAAVSMKLGVA